MNFRAACLPGFIAFAGNLPASVDGLLGDVESIRGGAFTLLHWNAQVDRDQTVVLSRLRRRPSGSLPAGEIADLMLTEPGALTRLLPPFGAVAAHRGHVQAVADAMGFQPIFYDAKVSGEPLLSSSALLAAWSMGASLDEGAVGVQSLLGWQLGQHTLFTGIRKLMPGAVGTMDEGGVRLEETEPFATSRLSLQAAVSEGSRLLRMGLEALLDEHPDAVLQLTGGLDSRLLLSAIPPARRRGLRAMTLSVPGSGDAAIASSIARRFGIVHEVQGLADIAAVSPAEAWGLVSAESVRLDAMADPVALAAQRIAERNFAQGVRISGLGGEIARGFYYVGRVRDRTYNRADAEKLASWRMFVNDAVEPGMLTAEFASWAHEVATDRVYEALMTGGDEWFSATDALYVRHRMQRWAGATDVAVSNQRMVINPMLDYAFLEVASRLAPQDKQNSRFLAMLQVDLDPELGDIPLEGRPAPVAYAHPAWWEPLLMTMRTGQRLARKALQRVRRGNRPPAGGEILAAKIVEHLRDHPDFLEPLGELNFLQPNWIEDMLSRRLEPRPSSVALMVNLIVAMQSPNPVLSR